MRTYNGRTWLASLKVGPTLTQRSIPSRASRTRGTGT
jgi:hypothetical protein